MGARGIATLGAGLALFFAGCSSTPNHLGNPVTLPIRALTHQLSEAPYRMRRARVAEYVHQNHAALLEQIQRGSGPALEQALTLAGHPAQGRQPTRAQLQQDYAIMADPEAMIVSLMVLSG